MSVDALAASDVDGIYFPVTDALVFARAKDPSLGLYSSDGFHPSEQGSYLAALRHAQMDIDLHPESFKHHHLRAVPEKYRHQVDVRTFGTGERIVFLPYTREVFARLTGSRCGFSPAGPGPGVSTRS